MQGAFYKNINPHLKFNKTIGEFMDAEATVKLIIQTVNTYSNSPFIKKVVEILSKGNPSTLEFLKRLFEVACKNVSYLRDPQGHEIVFTPKLLMQVGKGDCKKFTTFIQSVLKAKGIPSQAKVVSYDGNNWAHIYAIVPTGQNSYITLDPVNHCKYNKEVDYKKAQVFNLDGTKSQIMNKLSLMGSLGNLNNSDFLSGIGEAADDVLADIDDSFGGRRRNRRSCHNPAALAGLGNDFINGINDDYSLDGEEEFLSGIEELEGTDELGRRKIFKRPVLKRPVLKRPVLKRPVAKIVKKVQAKRAARKTPAAKAARKAKRKKIFKGVKKLGFAPTRAAFLALVALGGALRKSPLKINLAGKLAQIWQQDNGREIVKVWETFGGKRSALAKAISRASGTSISGEEFQVNADGSFLSGLGVVTATAAAATIAAATPITIAILKLLKNKGAMTEPESNFVEDVSEVAEDVALQQSGGDIRKVVLKAAQTNLLREGADIDEGGNVDTQREIIEEASAEPEVEEGDYSNFKPVARTSSKPATSLPAAKLPTANKVVQRNAPTQQPATFAPPEQTQIPQDAQEQTQEVIETVTENSNPRNLPSTKDQFAPRAKNIMGGYKNPITWLKALLYCILLSSIYKINPAYSSFVGCGITIILLITLINLSIQKIKTNGKIRY